VLENVSDRITGFQIAGPRARDLLQDVREQDVSSMRFLDVRTLTIGLSRAVVQRVSYTGDLGYEIYVDAMEQRRSGRCCGLRASSTAEALRHARDDEPAARPVLRLLDAGILARLHGGETGLDRFVAWQKNSDFIGRAAAEAERARGPARRLCNFVVEAGDADVVAYEPVWHGGGRQGFCTSGGYSHHAERSVAIGFLPVELIEDGLAVEIEILGEMRPARLVAAPLFDPDGARMRG
jgi:dimethylglycine dehydrogenase